jgi:glycosyltransferase involved in cell wall biosynthesis
MALKVSIITAVFNGASTIADTIESVIQQDYKNIEYIIIDNQSTDGTMDIVRGYSDHIDTFISEPDQGVYDAMNKGIKLASGDIIATLNSDDVYADATIARQMVEFMESQNLDTAYGDLVYIDKNNPEKIARFWQAGEYKKGAFYHGWVPPHPTLFCRKQIFEKYGYFNAEYQIAADFELMLRLMEKHNIKVGYLRKITVRMRTGGRTNSLKGFFRGNYEIIHSFKANGLKFSPVFFLRKPTLKISQLLHRFR